MWAAVVQRVSHPSYVRSCVLGPVCPNEILSSGTYTSPQEVTDESEIETCPLYVMRISKRSLQGNTTFANLQLYFFASLIPLLHVTEETLLCAVSHDFRLFKCKFFCSVWLADIWIHQVQSCLVKALYSSVANLLLTWLWRHMTFSVCANTG